MAEEKQQGSEVTIQEQLSKAEEFLDKNKKSLGIIVGAIVLAVVGYLLYEKVYVADKEKEASAAMFVAEENFRKDSLKLAIVGNKNGVGFENIIEDYSVSPSANLAHFYLGMSYLKKGDYDKAIETLKDYSAKDDITGALALGAIGDAYMEQSNTDDAIKYYKKAAKETPNKFTSPLYLNKLAIAYEIAGNYKDAAETYDKLKKEYPETQEGRNAVKYQARAEALANK